MPNPFSFFRVIGQLRKGLRFQSHRGWEVVTLVVVLLTVLVTHRREKRRQRTDEARG